ncbi:ABC-type cobalamin/Fe3+-siderophore transport system, ATPase component [Marinitoga piezophila KA3]|uniref:ABC-type cobalamin/Fe3+-siderophore transport system, ATPase component n=1 Tax=Marinitoga piezophila (strain DSM 14283 / JCM 11233 / KA3) TaxID=443254 RepID=H2J7S4_MARPK|nr:MULTISPECIES: ABC transporter ATP-binding protein [Marinitoga]AEX85415.1 ABC-type cobalamin/Fe3+-siderophore transport system, ATPase component [Marinitoga piezophila KA3]
MSILKIKDLIFSYNNHFKLNISEMYLEKGEFVSIIGPNGSGKTTILKLLTGLEKPMKGNIYVENKSIYEYSKKELFKKIAVVPQEFFTSFDFKVEDIISSGRIPYAGLVSVEENNKVMEETMKKTNTYVFKNRVYNYLSGGEKQRVMLTRALVQQTDILLLDEFVSQIDPGFTQQLIRMVKNEVVENNKGILAIFHDINIASLYSDRIYILKNGEIKYSGTPEKVITRKIMKEIFDIECFIVEHPFKNKPQVIFEY